MRQYWLRNLELEERLVTGLYALRSLPTELRRRVMEPVIDLQWREFVAEYKHRFQSETARRADLTSKVSAIGVRLRRGVGYRDAASKNSDIELCAGFVAVTR